MRHGGRTTAQNPRRVLSNRRRGRGGARLAERPRPGRPRRNWPGPDARAVPLAGRHAAMPLCRSLGHGLWEVRSDRHSQRIARILFCVVGERIVALHGFIKKTQKTPPADLALKRKREFEREE